MQARAEYWERPDWIYAQAQRIDVMIKTPEMIALRERSMPLFQQHMAKQFPEFFNHYTKIFFRAILGKLNGPLFLMLLKQRQKMDTGEIAWEEGNQEVIGASFNLLVRKLPQEMQDKILATYKDLVEEEKAEMRAAVEQVLKKDTPPPTSPGGQDVSSNMADTNEPVKATEVEVNKVQEVMDSLLRAPQKIEVVE